MEKITINLNVSLEKTQVSGLHRPRNRPKKTPFNHTQKDTWMKLQRKKITTEIEWGMKNINDSLSRKKVSMNALKTEIFIKSRIKEYTHRRHFGLWMEIICMCFHHSSRCIHHYNKRLNTKFFIFNLYTIKTQP